MANNIFFEEQPEQDFDLVPDEDQIDVSLDPDPLFDDGARPRRSRKRTGILIAGGCAVLALLCIGVYFIVSQARASREIAAQAAAEQDEERIKAEMALQQSQEYEAIVNATTFLEGVTVEGIAIGGKTMTEAETLLSEVIESKKLSGTLPLTYGDKTYSFDLSGVSITTNLSDVLAQAFQLARSGGVEDVLAEAEDIRTNGKAYTLTIQYDFTSVNTQVAALALEIDQPAQNATFGQIDKEKHTVAVVEATGGVEVDQEALTSAITAALMGGDYTTPIEIPVKETTPTLTGDAFELISTSAETSFSGSTSNRKYNIRKGADLINGTVLKPGETFSTNGVLGTRTLANGWKMANAYVSGATEEQAVLHALQRRGQGRPGDRQPPQPLHARELHAQGARCDDQLRGQHHRLQVPQRYALGRGDLRLDLRQYGLFQDLPLPVRYGRIRRDPPHERKAGDHLPKRRDGRGTRPLPRARRGGDRRQSPQRRALAVL